jgi:hypothetical protein
MSNNYKYLLAGIFLAILVIVIGANAYHALAAPAVSAMNRLDPLATYRGGNGCNSAACSFQLTAIPSSDLTTEEVAGLLFMREEEKLARDVYNQMYALWGLRVFQNIASSEQNHMDQVKLLMDRYGLASPALDPGQFSDPKLQALYDQLITQGSVSLEEALKVGSLIEQTDINDLQTRLAQTDNADIQFVYNNLLNASNNHLRALSGGAGQQNGNGRGLGAGNGRGAYWNQTTDINP